MLTHTERTELEKICDSTLFDICIASYTTFKVGGKVKALCDVKERHVLVKLLAYLYKNNIPYVTIGNGSNMLVNDLGFDGIIIKLSGEFEKIDKIIIRDNQVLIRVGAGVNISHLLGYCRKNGIGGIEFLAGIPGTIGGAAAMNAGAFGRTIGEKVEKITMVTPCGDVTDKNRSDLKFLYRSLCMDPGSIITHVWLKLNHGDDINMIKKNISDYMRIRSLSQPIDYPSAGCIFKNPEGNSAGKLIDEVGLKGKGIGGAMVSWKHANFIINTGNARARDVITLISIIKDKIKKEKGIELNTEISFVGFG